MREYHEVAEVVAGTENYGAVQFSGAIPPKGTKLYAILAANEAAPAAAPEGWKPLPPLPTPDGYAAMTPHGTIVVPPQDFAKHNAYAIFTADQMHDYVKADRAASPSVEGVGSEARVRDLMLLAATDLAGWAKKYGDAASADTAQRLRDAALAAPASPSPAGQPIADFCDTHCTWLDHHPDCERAASPAGQSKGVTIYLTRDPITGEVLRGDPPAGQSEPVAPPNSLPDWYECQRILDNANFRKRAAAGLEGPTLDLPPTSPEPTELHRFIYEYDDADPYRSAWFMHRLELLLTEARAASPAGVPPLTFDEWMRRTYPGGLDRKDRGIAVAAWKGATSALPAGRAGAEGGDGKLSTRQQIHDEIVRQTGQPYWTPYLTDCHADATQPQPPADAARPSPTDGGQQR